MGCSRTIRRALLTAVAVGALPSLAFAADHLELGPSEAKKVVNAVRIDERIVVDGRLDEAAWQRAAVATDFLQQEPGEGAPAPS